MKRRRALLASLVAVGALVFPAYHLGAQSSLRFALPSWGIWSGAGSSSSLSFSAETTTGEVARQSFRSASFAMEPAFAVPGTPANRPPGAFEDTVRVVQDSSANAVNVLGNDTDPDGDPVTVISATQGSTGRVAMAPAGGSVLYTPAPGFSGGDSFVYTISDGRLTARATVFVTVMAHPPSNRPPAAVNDHFSVPQDRAGNALDVLSNDRDPDGDALRLVAVGQPAAGTAQLGATGANLLYTPPSGFAGVDGLTYTVTDGHGATSAANVSITVVANRSPMAVPDYVRVPINSSNTPVYVLDNDRDPEGRPLQVIEVSLPSNGATSVAPRGAHVTYTPSPGFSGTDSFGYVASDGSLAARGTVVVTVSGDNRSPVASDDVVRVLPGSVSNILDVLSNDGDPDNNPLAIVSLSALNPPAQGSAAINQERNRIIYTPPPGYHGTESYAYTASDGILSASATVTVTVQGSRVFLPLVFQDTNAGSWR